MADAANSSQRFRYGLLLGLIAVSLVFQLSVDFSDWSQLVIVILQGATLLLALRTSRARPAFIRLADLAVLVALLTSISAIIGGGDAGRGATAIVNFLLVGVAPVVVAVGVVRSVREAGAVTLNAVFGALCIYLMLGMFFSFAFGAIEALGSAPLFAETDDPSQPEFLYYSFTTLTTTGFGDLTVVGGLARALTIFEALLGQLYLVTVVAAVVSNLRPRRG